MNILLVSSDESKSIDYERAFPYNGINIVWPLSHRSLLINKKRQIVVARKTMMTARYTCQSY